MVPHEQGVGPAPRWTPTRRPARASTGRKGRPDPDGEEAGSWVFPFNRPLPPDAGDTQALAANTTDDTVAYDLAFAMIWADEEQVTNTNEAYAFASCRNCAAVAVSFQVVLIVGDSEVIVPQNIAAAVNSDCVQCLTYALASQLVVTIDGREHRESMAALGGAVGRDRGVRREHRHGPAGGAAGALEGYQEQIKDIIREDPAAQEALLRDGQADGAGQEPTSAPPRRAGPGRGRAHHRAVPDSGLHGPVGGITHGGAVAGCSGRVPGTYSKPESTTAARPTAPAPTPAESTQSATAPRSRRQPARNTGHPVAPFACAPHASTPSLSG